MSFLQNDQALHHLADRMQSIHYDFWRHVLSASMHIVMSPGIKQPQLDGCILNGNHWLPTGYTVPIRSLCPVHLILSLHTTVSIVVNAPFGAYCSWLYCRTLLKTAAFQLLRFYCGCSCTLKDKESTKMYILIFWSFVQPQAPTRMHILALSIVH